MFGVVVFEDPDMLAEFGVLPTKEHTPARQ